VETLGQITVAIIIAVTSSYFTTQFALGKFYSEKWWEEKNKFYSEIVNLLNDLIRYCEVKKEDCGNGTKLIPELEIELREKHLKAYMEMKRVTTIASFTISKEAEIILTNLRDRPKLKYEENPICDLYEDDYKFYNKALTDIIRVAKKDLNKY